MIGWVGALRGGSFPRRFGTHGLQRGSPGDVAVVEVFVGKMGVSANFFLSFSFLEQGGKRFLILTPIRQIKCHILN